MKTLPILLAVSVLAPTRLAAQTGRGTAIPRPVGSLTLDRAKSQIMMRGGTSPDILNRDLSAIRSASPATITRLEQSGLDEQTAIHAMASSWRLLRTGSNAPQPKAPLSQLEIAKKSMEIATFAADEVGSIKRMSPQIADETLKADQRALIAVMPEVAEELGRRGYSEEESRDALRAAYRIFRARPELSGQPPNAPLPVAWFPNFTSAMERQDIDSSPTRGANIIVNGVDTGDPTPGSEWLPPGSHTIEVSKGQAFLPAKRTVTIVTGRRPEPLVLRLTRINR